MPRTHTLQLLLISTLDGRTNLAGFQGEIADVGKVSQEIISLLAPITERFPPSTPGRPGKAVALLGVADEETHAAYVASGECQPIGDLDNWIFPSACHASRWLGCNNNDVGARLIQARLNGRDQASVRGLTFAFAALE